MRRACQRTLVALPVVFLLAYGSAQGQTRVTTPEQHFGHTIGSDYWLPDYTAFQAYWQKLAGESDRMVLDTIGTTEEGRPQLMAIITSPANHAQLDRYRQIAARLARAEGLTDEQARGLAREGKAVVWFDGGLHATEVLGASQLIETVYHLLSRDDEETLRFLDDLIILAVHANPDGMELVADWYMREPVPENRSTSGVPRLYQKYVGHDNNRDFYMSTQAETENMNRVMFTEWFPQIVYNHHQTGPAGTVMFAPPFRDPFNYNLHPMIPAGLDMIGGAMMTRFVGEGKPGVTNRSGANYSTWWNGGLRTITYYHNMYGLLTETIGNPTPMEIPLISRRQLASNDLPYPIEPQAWHFRSSVDYSLTANYAVFDIASRRREQFLYNIYAMGRDAIEEGSRDTWTTWPREIAAIDEALGSRGNGGQPGGFRSGPTGTPADFARHLRRPEDREPRGYILPSNQADFQTAGKLVDALLENGIIVHRATSDFTVNGKQYPAGSYVIKTAQSFRPHVMDMFEPQDHPDDIPYPGGAPTPPYDVAGWTLAYQMGIDYDRILDGFDGPFERIEGLAAPRVAGRVEDARAGWFLSHEVNDAFTAVSRLLAGNQRVYWLTQPVTVGGTTWPVGTFWIPARGNARRIIEAAARDQGLVFTGAQQAPSSSALELRQPRIALVDRYGGSMPSGWTRWLFEQFEVPHAVVYPQELDAGNLNRKYDVIVFVDGLIPEQDGAGGRGFGSFDESTVPAEYQSWLGNVTVEKTVPQLRRFLENGGTVLTIGSSTSLARHLGLPVANALVETVDGTEQELPRSKFYVPSSLLDVAVTNTHPLAHGMDQRAIVVYANSPTFRITGEGVTPIMHFDSPAPLRSGWAWGQERLENGVAAAEAQVGDGKLFLFGPEIAFRAQPHGTFKLLFNGIYYGAARETRLR